MLGEGSGPLGPPPSDLGVRVPSSLLRQTQECRLSPPPGPRSPGPQPPFGFPSLPPQFPQGQLRAQALALGEGSMTEELMSGLPAL